MVQSLIGNNEPVIGTSFPYHVDEISTHKKHVISHAKNERVSRFLLLFYYYKTAPSLSCPGCTSDKYNEVK